MVSIIGLILAKASFAAIAPLTFDFSSVIGDFILVTFAGHGVIKKIPISSSESPVFSLASSRARIAAASIGDIRFNTFPKRFGKRSLMSLKTAGHAELISGFL